MMFSKRLQHNWTAGLRLWALACLLWAAGTVCPALAQTLSIDNPSVLEGNTGTNAVFTVTLSSPGVDTVTVEFFTVDGTAVAGQDYTTNSGLLTFAPGETTQSISVAVIGDTLNEANEKFYMQLTNAVNATITTGLGTCTIVDDDTVPTISIGDVSILEGNTGTTSAVFTAALSAPSGRFVSALFSTSDGTAKAGTDYVAKSGTISIPPGTVSVQVAVDVLGNLLNEPNKTFYLSLGNANYAIISKGTGVGTIVNDDPLPSIQIEDVILVEGNSGTTNAVFTISLSAVSGQYVTVDYATANDTAIVGQDYLAKSGSLFFAAGVTTQQIVVTVYGDTANEADETFTLNLFSPVNATLARSQAVGTIVNDDSVPTLTISDVNVMEGNSGTTNAVFTVSVSAASGFPVSVGYATANGTALSGSDYLAASGTLTIPAGADSGSITVAVNGDLVTEPNETFVVSLSSPVDATLARNQGIGTIINDDAVPSLSIGDVSLAEGNSGATNAVLALTLSNPSSQTVSVSYSTADGTATTADNDYSLSSGTLTFLPGQFAATLSVPVNGDNKFEPNETLYVNFSNPLNANVSRGQAVVTIINDDPSPSLSINSITVAEGSSGSTNAIFIVTLSNPSSQTVAVNYSTADGTATVADNDFFSTSGTLTLAPGQLSGTIAVTVKGDTKFEPDEAFTVTLSGAVNASIANGQGMCTIKNDDTMPSLSINDVSVAEGNSGTRTAVFTVTLSNPTYSQASVSFATADNTASAGIDYVSTSGSLTFPPGSTTQTITVLVNGDTTWEPDETFLVGLSNPSNAGLARSSGIGTILNDDSIPTLTVADARLLEGNSSTTNAVFAATLSNPSSFPVSVTYSTLDGTATGGSDYSQSTGTLTLAPGVVSNAIIIVVSGDLLNELDETFFVTLSSPANATLARTQATGTIVNDDPVPSLGVTDVSLAEGNSGTTNAVFTVTLSATSGQTVTVNYATADGTATAGNDYTAGSGILTFSPGTTTRTITVPVIGDLVYEANETLYVNLSSAVNASISRNQGAATIINDDTLPAIAIGDVTLVEGNSGSTNAVFSVTLSNPSSQTVIVSYSTSGGTAISGSDYAAASGTLSFPPGSSNQPISVIINGDLLNEPNETFLVTLFGPVGATLVRSQATGTIVNDDALPSLSINDVSLVEGNSGTTNAVFTVTLSAPSGQIVSVNYASANGTATAGSDYAATSGLLVFSPGATAQTLAVVVNGDVLNELNETFFINLSNPTNATLSRAQGTGTVVNDDALPSVTIADAAILEGDTGTINLAFPLTLSAASGQTATVSYTTADGTALASSDYIATNGTVTFSPGVTAQNIVVAVKGDTIPEPMETFSVILSSPVNATFARSQAVGSIVDNEVRVVSLTNSAPLTIPTSGPASVYPSTMQLTGLPGTLSKVTVSVLGLNHTYPDDIDMLLVGPAGQKVMLMSDAGGSADLVGVELTFDDTAATSLPDSTQIASGTYKPTEFATGDTMPGPAPAGPYGALLNAFIGTDPNGTWSLYINDDSTGDGGSLDFGWRLTITTTNLVCCSSGSTTDFSVTMTDSPDPALTGTNLTYTLLVVNSGPAPATGVTLTDIIPANTSFLSVSTSQGTASQANGMVTCSLGSLALGAVARVSITVQPSVVGLITNTASVTGSQSDTVPGNNSAMAVTTVNLGPPSLSIGDVIVLEPNAATTNAMFKVSLSRTNDTKVTVNWATSSGTATAGTDYVPDSGSISFAPGVTNLVISVVVNGDLLVEPNETFFVTLGGSTNATIARANGTCTIVNNDGIVGEVDHLTWDPLSASQYSKIPFSTTVRAVDPGGAAVTSFTGTVTLSGVTGTGSSPSVLITELDTSGESVELANVSNFAVDISNWQVTLYDWFLWPDPEVNFVVPAGTICNAGDVFAVQSGGTYPGNYPNFTTGSWVYWLSDVYNNQVAVLLRDASGQAVDFVCAVDGYATNIIYPMTISASQWSGDPIEPKPDPATTYQRVGSTDQNSSNNWAVASGSMGSRNSALTMPFSGPKPVAVSPTQSASFVGGVWTGNIAVRELATNMYLKADDGQGHTGNSGQFTILPTVDLSVTNTGPAGLIAAGQNFTCLIALTNQGPSAASSVVLTDIFAGAATYISASTSQGSVSQSGNTITANMGNLAANASATLSVVLRADAPGTITNTTFVVSGSKDYVTGNNSSVLVTRVNYPPNISGIAAQVINEDASMPAIAFTVSDAETPASGLSVYARTSLATLVPDTNITLGGSGTNRTLALTPLPNQFGTVTITVFVDDGLGTNNSPFVVTVQPVNDPPASTKGTDQSVLEDGGQRSIVNWATSISAGPPNESGQLLTFLMSNNNNALFSAQPAISPGGTLTFTTATNANGSALVTVRLQDNGGTANGGVDLSPPQTFNISVTAVNDPPTFTKGPDQVVAEDSGPQTVVTWATEISAGPVDESGQSVNFIVMNNNNALFTAQPSISPAGTLTYTPTTNANGSAVVTVRLHDNGGTANGGSDTSAPQTFNVTMTQVNDPPILPSQSNVTINEGTILTVTNTATDADGSVESLSYQLVNPPAGAMIDTNGVITWTPSEAQGSDNYSLTTVVIDNGIPALSATNTFVVTVNEVNSAPIIRPIGDQSVRKTTLLTFTVQADDSDFPVQGITYNLDPGAPSGATINPTSGVFSWTPTSAQGPNTNFVTVRATDNGASPMSDAQVIRIVVTDSNLPPVLADISPKTVNEDSLLTFTVLATDGDVPAQTLTYSLDPGAPATASINPTTGVFTWIPSEAAGPSTNFVVVQVVDNGNPPAADSQTVTIVVNEVNRAPILAPVPDQTVVVGQTLWVTNSASDSDLPANTLVFSLSSGPVGATMTDTGVFSWTASSALVNTTNLVTISVADNGTPTMTDAGSFRIRVIEASTLRLTIAPQDPGGIAISWNSIPGTTYRVEYKENLGDAVWQTLEDVMASGGQSTISDEAKISQRFYRVEALH